jgi:hypothetical protein
MPVNSTHLEYDANAAVWLRARDVFAREAAVKDISSDFFAPSSAVFFTIRQYSLTTPSVHAHYSLTATHRFGLFSQP